MTAPLHRSLQPAWRAWRGRRLDDFLALGVVTACALVQGMFVLRAGLSINSVAEPFRPFMGLSILGSRLVTWTLFGPAAVRAGALGTSGRTVRH